MKIRTKVKTLEWNKDEFDEAIQWAKDTIQLIADEREWACNPDFYYCNYLCSQRNNCCEYKAR